MLASLHVPLFEMRISYVAVSVASHKLRYHSVSQPVETPDILTHDMPAQRQSCPFIVGERVRFSRMLTPMVGNGPAMIGYGYTPGMSAQSRESTKDSTFTSTTIAGASTWQCFQRIQS